MANPAFFKAAFDALATDGCIGVPNGLPAYAYMRVSSADQADDGRSGLPRQLQHIHEIALTKGYSIPWGLVFADDHSGFEFEDRPQLTLLRREMKGKTRRASALVIESLDRLSRHADWHQGYLLHEFKEAGLDVVFWQEMKSRIERAVVGAMAQDGMEQAKARMMAGNLHKAREGRVTARTAAYGYQLVDSTGKTGDKAKTDTHYAIYEPEAAVVRYIFRAVAIEGKTMRSVCAELEGVTQPPKRTKHWEIVNIRLILRNEVYKGEFYAHRKQEVKVRQVDQNGEVKIVIRNVRRPREEWIKVDVPAIVSPDQWEQAQRMLDKNKQMARRNAVEPYLLTGLVKCATCGLTYTGMTKTSHRQDKTYKARCYRCPSNNRHSRASNAEMGCGQSEVVCHRLDGAVWSVISTALLNPDQVIAYLDQQVAGEAQTELRAQLAHLDRELADNDTEDGKLYKAYIANVFDVEEYAARRDALKQAKARLTAERQRVHGELITPEQLAERKAAILAIANSIKLTGAEMNEAPFEVKRHVLKQLVDRITVNVNEGWFRIEGMIGGNFSLIVNTSEGTDSLSLSG